MYNVLYISIIKISTEIKFKNGFSAVNDQVLMVNKL